MSVASQVLLSIRLAELREYPDRVEAERACARALAGDRWDEAWAFYRVAFPGVLELAEAEEVRL